jgi:hypothetical protein
MQVYPAGGAYPPSVTRRSFALFAAGLVAWAITTIVDFSPALWAGVTASSVNPSNYMPSPDILLWWLSIYTIVGLPAALLMSFSLGSWALSRAIERNQNSRIDAAVAGTLVGVIVGLVSISFTVLVGLVYILSDNHGFSTFAGGKQIVSDGMPTLYGWSLELMEFLVTVVTGAAAGLTAGWAGGFTAGDNKGRSIHEQQAHK